MRAGGQVGSLVANPDPWGQAAYRRATTLLLLVLLPYLYVGDRPYLLVFLYIYHCLSRGIHQHIPRITPASLTIITHSR